MHPHGMSFVRDAFQGGAARLCTVAHDKKGRFHLFLLQNVQHAFGYDRARTVVEGEIYFLFACGKGEGCLGPNGSRAESCQNDQKDDKKYRKGNITFLHILSVGNFSEIIYICAPL